MAPGVRFLCLLLICGIVVNVETKHSSTHSKPVHHSSKPVHHTSKPVHNSNTVHHTIPSHHSPVHETIHQPSKHTDVHATQPSRTGNQGHGYPDHGSSGTGATKPGYDPFPRAPQKPPTHQPSYPGSGGLSGGSTNIANKPPVPQAPLYPGNSGLSGSGTSNINKQTASQATSYPGNSGLSGSGTSNNINNVIGHGASSGGGPHTYPVSNGQSGAGYKPKIPTTNVIHTHVEPSYTHIYIRNHPQSTTNIHPNNIHTTHIHYHPYKPPARIYYVDNGKQYHYPVYREKLPVYVSEYRTSRSRFNVLLTGLALYNLGHVSKNHVSHHYHNNYKPTPYEVCKFGVKYDSISYDEMDIDCRLITDFIWTLKTSNQRQILLPNGTLFTTMLQNSQMKPDVVQILHDNGTLARLVWNPSYDVVIDALDPRFNGEPLHIKNSMKCYIKYFDGYFLPTPTTKYVSCKLLQTYVRTSFNSASKITSSLIAIVLAIIVAGINY